MSRAAIVPGHSANSFRAYMPSNYEVFDYNAFDESGVDNQVGGALVVGHDDCGWTLEDYVIPRLASGLYFAKIIGEFDMADYPGYDLNDPSDAAIIVSDLSN